MLQRLLRAFDVGRDLFWIAALGVLLVFGFFAMLGALKPGEVAGLSIAVLALAVLWVVHAWLQGRHNDMRDPRIVRARERRGF
jgi:membrane protein implicated in regulation of membrane protease activity